MQNWPFWIAGMALGAFVPLFAWGSGKLLGISSGYAEACDALRGFDLTARLGEVRAPTLVIAGAQDVSTPIERAVELVDGIVGAELEVLDAAHLANVEQPADFTAALVRHLAD